MNVIHQTFVPFTEEEIRLALKRLIPDEDVSELIASLKHQVRSHEGDPSETFGISLTPDVLEALVGLGGDLAKRARALRGEK